MQFFVWMRTETSFEVITGQDRTVTTNLCHGDVWFVVVSAKLQKLLDLGYCQPRWFRLDARSTGDQEVAGSIPAGSDNIPFCAD